MKAYRTHGLGNARQCVLFFAAVLLAVLAQGCQRKIDAGLAEGGSCEVMCQPGPESNNLGPGDFNANYHGFATPVRPGEKMVMRAQFPHARYISINVYDEKLRPADAIADYEIVPSKGVNPFVPGTDRSADYLGEYEITVLMEAPPAGGRPPNTLYAGVANDGTKNKAAFLGYRVYLSDKGMGYREGHPLGAHGGVPPPRVVMYDKDGNPYCPAPLLKRAIYYRGAYSVLRAFIKDAGGMAAWSGEAQSPPAWINRYGREDRQGNVVVGNDETIYISAAVDNKYGDLLVLQWPAARVPAGSHTGGPIEAGADMRYWSLAFAYRDSSYFAGFPTETSLSDIEVPRLPNGDCRLVIGFGGVGRPDFVPPEQWVGLEMEKGVIIMRNIMIDPDYEGDFGKLPRGEISGPMKKFTPGGTYYSAEELRKSPGL